MLASSMWTATTGLLSHQDRLDVVGNNIANVNTVGFKKSNQTFADVFSNTLHGAQLGSGNIGTINPLQIGMGTYTDAVTPIFSQGGLETTGRTLDIAIEGDSFFTVRNGTLDTDFFTRDGVFYLDGATGADGNKRLLAGAGLSVMGWNATNGVLNAGDIEEVYIPEGQILPGNTTSAVSFGGNLNAGRPVVQPNTIQTTIAGPGWISNTGAAINVGHVETSQALWSKASGAAATAAIDLADVQYSVPGANATRSDLFSNLVAGDTITLNFDKAGNTQTADFTYGVTGTTLSDLSTWMAGGLGDAGAATTERLDGGVLGTIRTQARAAATDGFDAPAEQAGAYLRSEGGQTLLSIASNLGSTNAISGLELVHNGARIGDVFSLDAQYGGTSDGGYGSASFDSYVTNPAGGVQTEKVRTHFSLVERDNTGSSWRWIADGGGQDSTRGTGLVRFGTTGLVAGQIQDTPSGITFDMSEMTQLAVSSDVELATQDGYAEGVLENYTIDGDGIINGRFSNGLNRTLSRIALASIPNSAGMQHTGNNLWALSPASGKPLYNTVAGTPGFGNIRSGTLESSNVELSNEMVSLITTQRGWQANSKMIMTTDEMLQELARLKR